MRCFFVYLAIALYPILVQGADTPLRIVKVERADLVRAQVGERAITLRLGGIWAPTPPGQGQEAHYMGEPAREMVAALLVSEKVVVRPIGALSTKKELPVRIELEDGTDLAELLARLGLAMCVRGTAANQTHGDALCQAERNARKDFVGIHDGGFKAYAHSRDQVVDLGVLMTWTGSDRGSWTGVDSRVGSPASGTGWWATPGKRAPMRSAQAAIRDYGRSMGLPADASRSGR